MKKFLAVLFSIFFFAFIVQAQQTDEGPKMSVRSFALAENDNTANLSGTMVRDQNGDPCALIRVQTTQTGFAWDFGQMQPLKVEQKTGEIWIYVPYGVKRMTVRHARLGTMTYEFPIPIEKARTYVMNFVSASVMILVEPEVTQQYLIFKLNPEDAIVELDGMPMRTEGGYAKKLVKFGEYSYHIYADDYHPTDGTVVLDDPDNKKIIEVVLKPFFGTVKFHCDQLDGAVILVDGKKIECSADAASVNISSGKHVLKIVKDHYRIFTQEFTVNDGENLVLPVTLQPNFAKVSISTLDGAQIYANGEFLGTAPWRGNLDYDTYSFEIRKTGYKSVFSTLEFTSGSATSFKLPEPAPLYGCLDIDSNPVSAVIIDGDDHGQTPLYLPKTLVGEHTIEISKNGFVPVTKKVILEEGKTETVIVNLQPLAHGESLSDVGAVDLGLSVKWATCNIGASRPEEYGDYFAWGEIQPKEVYLLKNYKWCDGSESKIIKYNTGRKYGVVDNKMILEPQDDAATVKLGGNWRIPTEAEWKELKNNCTWVWTTVGGVEGYKAISKKPGYTEKFIFFPMAGCKYIGNNTEKGVAGYYWSSSLAKNYSAGAEFMQLLSGYVTMNDGYRCYGRSVRPVLPPVK